MSNIAICLPLEEMGNLTELNIPFIISGRLVFTELGFWGHIKDLEHSIVELNPEAVSPTLYKTLKEEYKDIYKELRPVSNEIPYSLPIENEVTVSMTFKVPKTFSIENFGFMGNIMATLNQVELTKWEVNNGKNTG